MKWFTLIKKSWGIRPFEHHFKIRLASVYDDFQNGIDWVINIRNSLSFSSFFVKPKNQKQNKWIEEKKREQKIYSQCVQGGHLLMWSPMSLCFSDLTDWFHAHFQMVGQLIIVHLGAYLSFANSKQTKNACPSPGFVCFISVFIANILIRWVCVYFSFLCIFLKNELIVTTKLVFIIFGKVAKRNHIRSPAHSRFSVAVFFFHAKRDNKFVAEWNVSFFFQSWCCFSVAYFSGALHFNLSATRPCVWNV